jgi:chromosome segregation ATPase
VSFVDIPDPFSKQLIPDLLARTSKLDAAQRALAQSQKAYQQLERELAAQNEHVHRLAEANDILSQRALTLADEMDQDKRVAHAKLEKEIESLRKQLKGYLANSGWTSGLSEQTQRIQLLDELNSLQSEVTRLRAQLRGAH